MSSFFATVYKCRIAFHLAAVAVVHLIDQLFLEAFHIVSTHHPPTPGLPPFCKYPAYFLYERVSGMVSHAIFAAASHSA